MTSTAKQSIAFNLGRAFGAVMRFCLFDKNPLVRWGKRGAVFIALALTLASSLSVIIGSFLSIGCVALVAWALSKGNPGLLAATMDADAHNSGSDDDSYRAPFYGEHEHPDYNLHFKD